MAKQLRPLSGKVVAVTGAARGIGRATAALLVSHGAKVAIGDIDVELAQRTAAELGPNAVGLALDVTDRTSFETFLRETESRLGPLAVLVNNAGIMPVGPFVDETDATAQRLVDINLHGVMLGSKLALERFLARRSGHLVNVASVAGKGGFPGGVTYCATKHAVVGLSEAIRAEVRGSGIDVSIVMPVVVNTELGSGLRRSRIRVVEPEDVARAIVEAIQTGRVDVYVPRFVGHLFRVMPLTPRPAVDWLVSLLGAHQVLVDPDPEARAAYARRTAVTPPPAADAPAGDALAAEVPAAAENVESAAA
ncbi:MAG: SDR family oxidoreductase [Solirubrobacteraceae bacterium]